jgi:hypothetical protein
VVDPASQPVGNAGVRVDLKGKEVCRGHTSATGEFVCPERRYRRGSRLHVAVTAHRFHELDTQLKFSPTLTNIRLSIKPLFDLSQPAPEVRPGTEPLVGEVPLP